MYGISDSASKINASPSYAMFVSDAFVQSVKAESVLYAVAVATREPTLST